jgi:hypothetical protein
MGNVTVVSTTRTESPRARLAATPHAADASGNQVAWIEVDDVGVRGDPGTPGTVGPPGPQGEPGPPGSNSWADITGKPSTFPPTLPIAEADVTNLVTDLAAKANLAGATFTGKVTVPTVVAGGAGFMLGQGAADPTTPTDGDVWINGSVMKFKAFGATRNLLDQNSVQTVSGAKTFSAAPVFSAAFSVTAGKASFAASVAGAASLNIGAGVAVTSPVTGDIWTNGNALFYQSAATSLQVGFLNVANSWTTVQTFTQKTAHRTSNAGAASISMPHGVAPTTPVDGDLWTTTAGMFVRINGATVGPLGVGGGGGGISDAPSDGKLYARLNGTWDDLTNDLAGKADIAGATFTGKVVTPASAAGGAGLNIGNGAAPTTPANGDIWISGSILQFWNGSGYINCIVNSGTQSIGGAKTFTTSPILPTPTAGDNSTKGATTAYVDAADALKANLAGATFTGKVTVPASTAGGAGINIGNGGAPSSPVDGDLWVTTGGVLTWQGNTTTYAATNLSGTQTISGNKTFSNTANAISGRLVFNASDATRHRLNVAASTTIPAAPADGDVWSTASGFYGRVGGVTRPMSVHVGTTAPSSPITNDLWVDTT